MYEIRPFSRNNYRVFDPFREIAAFENAMMGGSTGMELSPIKTDIQDKGDSYLLEADLPGFNREDIHVDVDADRLTLSCQRHSEHENKESKDGYISCERSYGSYTRSFDMTGIDTEGITASYTDGVLRLNLPKKQPKQTGSRRLEIE